MSTIEVEIIEAGFTKEQVLIKDIYFTIDSGEIVGLVGVSGAGKTVIIKAMLDNIPYTKGEMRIHERFGQYSYVPELPSFYEGLTMLDHIELITSMNKEFSQEQKKLMYKIIERFDLTAHLNQFPITFSKGMQHKFCILLGLIKKADLYIFDDPFSNLDIKSRQAFIDYLKVIKQTGVSILIASTAAYLEENLCDNYIYIHSGTVYMAASHNHIKVKCELGEEDRLDCLYHLDLRRHIL